MMKPKPVNDKQFNEGIDLLRHFRAQLRALSDERTLLVLKEFGGSPFTNGDLRPLLGVSREATWESLSKLVSLGMVEKRGHGYRVSRFSYDFVGSVADTLKQIFMGAEASRRASSPEILKIASQGLEFMYAKGKIGETEYFASRKVIEGQGQADAVGTR